MKSKNDAEGKMPKVKIVAIAKDEAAYIPEWVHHHMYFGFDAIDVYINRTSDNSFDLVEKISQKYPKVRALDANWVDLCPLSVRNNLQYVIYAKAYEEGTREGNFDYILFLDIDEFWTPKNMLTTIQDCIRSNPTADTISFEWINEFGQDREFSSLGEKLIGRINPLVKTLIKLGGEITSIGFHYSEFKTAKSVLVDGDEFKSDEKVREGLHKDLRHLRPVMIIHRMFRSPMEYISLLNRGRPSDEVNIKLNRGGYNEASGREVVFELNASNYLSYQRSFEKFMLDLSIDDEVKAARQFVKKRYSQTLTDIKQIPRRYLVDLLRVFKGCNSEEYQIVKDAIINSNSLRRCKNADELIDIAKKIEKIDIHIAHEIWILVAKIRPKGPMIKARIKSYELLINSN